MNWLEKIKGIIKIKNKYSKNKGNNNNIQNDNVNSNNTTTINNIYIVPTSKLEILTKQEKMEYEILRLIYLASIELDCSYHDGFLNVDDFKYHKEKYYEKDIKNYREKIDLINEILSKIDLIDEKYHYLKHEGYIFEKRWQGSDTSGLIKLNSHGIDYIKELAHKIGDESIY